MSARASLALLSVVVFVTITYEVLPVGLLTPIADQLRIDQQSAGLLVGGYAVAVAVGSIPLSAMVARFNPRTTLVTLLLAFAASAGLFSLSTTLTLALLARLLGGVVHAMIFTSVYRLALAMISSERRGRAAAVVAVGNGVALAGGVPIVSAIGVAAGWQVAAAALAATFVVVALLALLLIPKPAADAGDRQRAGQVLVAVARPPLLRVGLTIVVITMAHFATFTYIEPLLLQRGITPLGISTALFAYGAAAIVGLLIVTPLTGWRPRALLIPTAALIAVALLVCLVAPVSASASYIAVVIWGLALGALPVLVQVLAIRASEQLPSAAAPLVNSTFNVGITVGSAAGGALLGAAGPSVLMTVSVVAAVVVAAVCSLPGWLPADRVE